jgi:uracil-DNA glycosylase family 4
MEQEAVRTLNRDIVTCTRCRLALTRINAVPGEGPGDSQLFFIGEAPGKNEDITGRPFVGRAGAILDDLLSSIGLERSSVFITSIIKCRPPENRNPGKDEIAACAGYLCRQIDHFSPELIVPMGRLASVWIFSRFGIPYAPISSIHGKIFHAATPRKKLVIIPVYHPAAMTHNPLLKGALFEDFKVIGEMLGTKEIRGRNAKGMNEQPLW